MDDADLWARGRKWLDEASSEHRSWGHIWRVLWRSPGPNIDTRADLASTAIAWLGSDRLRNPVWPIVWNILWDDSDLETETLALIARDLLSTAPPKDINPVRKRLEAKRDHVAKVDPWRWKDGWEARWNETSGDGAGRNDLADQAKTWLGAFDLTQRGWTSIWKYVWSATPDDSADQDYLFDLATRWLNLVEPSHPRWAGIWQILWQKCDSSSTARKDQLAASGRAWLNSLTDIVDWPLVWIALWNIPDYRDGAMRVVARSRLGTSSPAHRHVIEARLLAE